MAEGKRPYLKKGAGFTRFRQRSVALNPPVSPLTAAAAAEISSSENAQTSTQSLPLIDNLSPITKEPALNIRPTTAETGDSGVRDINLQISPSNDSGSVRTTVTTNNRESPPKAPAETNVNESEGENLVQQYLQINPTSARLIEKHGPELVSGSLSSTNSYTSLDQIQTPQIGNRTKENESPSNYSEEINASSRSKGSTSVGTSAAHNASNETENNDSLQVVHDSSGANKPSSLDSTLQFNGNHNRSLPPPTQYQHYDDTPLNSKRHDPLFKSHSSSSLLHGHNRKPQSYFGQTARRFGNVPTFKFVLPPRPQPLESPDVVNGLGTPQASSTKNNIFCQTPILSENFVKNEDGKIVESLAEQLRAVLVCIDVGMDERRLRVKR
uniref:Uncharacterized protein n=1 Tax=Panagrolaimus sp. PS1159 TaxID=55785 RepID=A0AC35EUD7_9BILA